MRHTASSGRVRNANAKHTAAPAKHTKTSGSGSNPVLMRSEGFGDCPNLDLNHRSSSGQHLNPNPKLRFGPVRFGFGPRFGTELCHHYSKVAQTIYQKLRTRTPNGFYLVADSAFPRGSAELRHGGFIRVPMKAGETLRMTDEEMRAAVQFDNQLLSCRQAAEWGMRTIQGSFGRLQMPLPINDTKWRANLVEICVRLSNVRAL